MFTFVSHYIFISAQMEPVARLKNQLFYPDKIKPGTEMKEEEAVEISQEEIDAALKAIEDEKERLRLEELRKNPPKERPKLLTVPKKTKKKDEDVALNADSKDKDNDKGAKRDKSPKKEKKDKK